MKERKKVKQCLFTPVRLLNAYSKYQAIRLMSITTHTANGVSIVLCHVLHTGIKVLDWVLFLANAFNVSFYCVLNVSFKGNMYTPLWKL